MGLIRTASVALVLGFAVATSTPPPAPSSSTTTVPVAAETAKNPICAFFYAIFHHRK